ncbi:MAG: hypothetical protein ACK559_35650 [bacterium]
MRTSFACASTPGLATTAAASTAARHHPRPIETPAPADDRNGGRSARPLHARRRTDRHTPDHTTGVRTRSRR